MDWKDIAKGYDAPPEDLQQPLNIQRCTMKVVFEMNLAALCVSVRCSRGDFYRWQWKWGENALLCGSSCLLTPNNVGKHKLRMKWLKTGAQPPSETPQASPPRLVLTLLIAAGFWGKKEAENVSVFICFKSRPVLLQIHKKQHFFPSFFLSLARLQHRPETRTDGDILCNPLRAYLDLSGSCILQQWRNNVFISSCSLETGGNEKKKKRLLKGFIQSTFFSF